MSGKWLVAALAVFACAEFSTPARSAVMQEVCAEPNTPLDKLARATAFLLNVHAQTLARNADGTYSLSYSAYVTSGRIALSPESPYFGTPQAPAGRSGVLVSQDSVLTAAHADPFDYASFAVVFGLHTQRLHGECVAPDLAHIPAANVYFPKLTPDGHYAGLKLNTSAQALTPRADLVVLTLDRPVSERQPLPVRKSGTLPAGQHLVGLYFSEHLLSAKLDDDIRYTVINGILNDSNTAQFVGASGGPLFNLDQGLVENVVAYANSCAGYEDAGNRLFKLMFHCPGGMSPVNGDITVISTHPDFPSADIVFADTFNSP